MKNKMKKMVALLAAVVMVLTMNMSVFAANEPTEGNLKVNNNDNTYTAYQVMTSTVSGYDADENPMYTYTVTEAFKGFFENGVYSLDSDNQILKDGVVVAGDGLNTNTNTSEASKLAAALSAYARANNITGVELPADTSIGYYVIAETKSKSNTGRVASKPILVDLRDDTTITPKDDDIKIDKVIVEDETEKDKNNVSIGDTVSYKVTTSIPTYEANVDKDKLTYVLTDTFTGLKYNKDVVVTIGGTTMTAGVDYDITTSEDGKFVIELKKDTIFNHQGEEVVLIYSADLTDAAAVDDPNGNPNHIKLEYTNNPNKDDSVDYIEDDTKTYTYGFKLHKVDKNNDTVDMSGAEFEIKNAAGEVIGKFTFGDNGSIEAEGIVISLEGNIATIKGLDAGTYTITETKAPNGYAMLANPIEITIADAGEEAGGDPTGIAQITIDGAAVVEGEAEENGDGTINLIAKVENIKGISLPETGAKTALYCMIVGGVLVILGGLYISVSKFAQHKKH